MKKITAAILALVTLFALCVSASAANTHFDQITLAFSPSVDADALSTATEKLPELFIAEMSKHGYELDEVNIVIGESYDDTGAVLAAGSADLAWLPGGTYAAFSDRAEVILTATRDGISNDSENPADWNGEDNSTFHFSNSVSFYRALICATPSKYGRMLAEKVNNGEELSWEELNGARWVVQSSSSLAGHIYPSMWLMDKYDGRKISDLDNVTLIPSGYGAALSCAADESADIIVCYADARLDYEESWMLPTDQQDAKGNRGLGRDDSIWNEVNVIGVSERIFNDTVSVSKESPFYTKKLKAVLQDCLINIISTEEGKEVFGLYNHTGYATAVDSDYDGARIASLLAA